MNENRHKKALIVLAILIALALITVFIIHQLSNENETVVEYMKENYKIYISGLAALFIILFYAYNHAYKKILATICIVALAGTIFYEADQKSNHTIEQFENEEATEDAFTGDEIEVEANYPLLQKPDSHDKNNSNNTALGIDTTLNDTSTQNWK